MARTSYRVIRHYALTVQGDEWCWRVAAESDELPRTTLLPISFATQQAAEAKAAECNAKLQET